MPLFALISRFRLLGFPLLAAAATAGCASGGLSGAATGGGGPLRAVESAAAASVAQGPPAEAQWGPAARQSFLQPIRRLDVIAATPDKISVATAHAATLERTDEAFRPTRLEAAQIGLLYGSPEGRAFVETMGPRALAQGEPPAQCPALTVGRGASGEAAAREAFEGCFAALAEREDCGCRLLAEGDRLLAGAPWFSYALGVSAALVDPQSKREMTLVAEERAVPSRPGASTVWLLGFDGPKGALHLEADGAASLALLSEGRASNPQWRGQAYAEGFRRGRVARRVFLTDAQGRERILLVGFEAQEMAERHDELLEPPPALAAAPNRDPAAQAARPETAPAL